MADLDKKIQKAAPDLVQSVLEAQEKRNVERVDMLITNAIKQLKMSRFKPDQTTCLGLTYLARINPRIFRQSTVIKDTLKSLIRRDNGPTNIKGKNDIVLPVLAANILLACCDTSEARTMILSKIDQWLNGTAQKAGELIQHLLATLCMKCKGDQQTIGTLIEMRQHWLQYLEDNFDLYGSIPVDLCANIRKLLHSESDCDCLVGHLNFLIKHDNDIDGLGDELGKFILDRPISLNNMLKQDTSGPELNRMILRVFIKLFEHLGASCKDRQSEVPMEEDPKVVPTTATTKVNQELSATSVIVKQEPKLDTKPVDNQTESAESKPEVKTDVKQAALSTNQAGIPKEGLKPKPDTPANEECIDEDTITTELPPAITYLYIRMADNPRVIKLNRHTLEALLYLISSVEESTIDDVELAELLRSWLVSEKSGRKQLSSIYEDFALTKSYNLPGKLRQKLIQFNNELLVELALRDASANQLITMLQQFGSSPLTIEKINKRLATIKDTDLLRSKIDDITYFNNLMEFYAQEMGSKSSKELQTRLTASVS